MQIYSFTVGPFGENTYLLAEENQALIIDPGFTEGSEYQQITSRLDSDELSLSAVVLTHAHVDHVLGLPEIMSDFDIPVFLNDQDRYLWNNVSSQATMFGLQTQGFSFEPEPLEAPSHWSFGNFTFDVRFTPGHAPDHVSLYHESEGLVIAGDALFKEGIGRTDLYKGDMQVLKKSIKEQLYSLPDETVVYPGHGPQTTIGHEKKANPFVHG